MVKYVKRSLYKAKNSERTDFSGKTQRRKVGNNDDYWNHEWFFTIRKGKEIIDDI